MGGAGPAAFMGLAVVAGGIALAAIVVAQRRLTPAGRRDRELRERIGAVVAAGAPGPVRALLDAGGVPKTDADRLHALLLRHDLEAGRDELALDAHRFVRLVRHRRVNDEQVAVYASVVAGNEAEAVLFGRASAPLLPGDAAERLAAAEALLGEVPPRRQGDDAVRAALGIVRLAQGRPAEARVLLDVRLRGDAFTASVRAVQAVAASDLGERDEAMRLLAAARDAAARVPGGLVRETVRDAAARVLG